MIQSQLNESVRRAFLATSGGFSVDRVVADPNINEEFLRRCREEGLTETPSTLNRCLLNLRKTGQLAGLRRTVRTSFTDEDDYAFASEIAVRFLERTRGITLDEMICDPETARIFDATAFRIAPGYGSLRYRWAALNLRKARRLHPEPLGHVISPESITNVSVNDLNVNEVPQKPGLYMFLNP